MTAVNVILRPTAAFVVTDGERRYGGQVVHSAPKVLPLPHLNAALAVRGDWLMLTTMYGIITGRRTSFEDAAANLGQDLADAAAGVSKALPLLSGHDVVLTGWPETRPGPECWLVTDHERYGLAPFKAASLDGLLMPDDGTLKGKLAAMRLFDRREPFEALVDGNRIIAAQQALPGSGVGGFCQVTVVTPEGIYTRITAELGDSEPAQA
ncbi:hypothetical protein [Methylobacterium frigidaeris]|uniref:Uncharacterized protein n=1 Tax=Methylobacterium frigidaeris TaxID=2038277 RepID=A0AA37HER2_9HYPH|nr:hypothetical protein [Methylobacterium frigidaeris]GJD64409.1 hypothetical protein MPEAHAMD_4591 [Methylobacterium frigidaeris]